MRPGLWRLRATVGGRRVSRTVQVDPRAPRREVEAALRSLQAEAPRSTRRTVPELLDRFVAHLEARGRTPRTVAEARRTASRVLGPALPMRVSRLTTEDVDALWTRLSREGAAPASVRRYHAVLSAALELAVDWEWIPANPAKRAHPPPLRRREIDLPSVVEVRSLIANVAARGELGERLAALLLILATTGMRRGEACGLRWSDVDLDAGTIRVRRSIWRVAGELGEGPPKSGRERTITPAPEVMAWLRGWRETTQPSNARCWVVSRDPSGLRPINPDTLTSAVHRAARALGIDVHVHTLRHWAATEMVGSGVSVADAAAVLGHASPRMILEVYGHPVDERGATGPLAKALPARRP